LQSLESAVCVVFFFLLFFVYWASSLESAVCRMWVYIEVYIGVIYWGKVYLLDQGLIFGIVLHQPEIRLGFCLGFRVALGVPA
jgi:hypothetical protein